MENPTSSTVGPVQFHGGTGGAVLPLLVFLGGVAWLGLSGAPDERGFWPILLLALAIGLALARDRHAYAEAALSGMSRPIVMVMIMAWLLAGVLASTMAESGFVEALVWATGRLGIEGGAYVAAAFLVCCAVSTATGTSLGTMLVCGPLLYPAGGAAGAAPAFLAGAIIGGATFGDNISPVSDTTIASATTQGADMGGVVRSRLRYALPVAGLALIGYAVLGNAPSTTVEGVGPPSASPTALVMVVSPATVFVLLLRGRHLLHGLVAGIVVALAVGLTGGLIDPSAVLHVDAEQFGARGLIVTGIERGVGASVFTILLMGVVGGTEASGLLDRVVASMSRTAASPRKTEGLLVAITSAVVVLTTHSVVAILTVGDLARDAGAKSGLSAYRRANLLDLTVCTYPFLLPFFIPTIIASSVTQGADVFGMPSITPLAAGLHNLHSWGLLAMIVVAIATGYGRASPPGTAFADGSSPGQDPNP